MFDDVFTYILMGYLMLRLLGILLRERKKKGSSG